MPANGNSHCVIQFHYIAHISHLCGAHKQPYQGPTMPMIQQRPLEHGAATGAEVGALSTHGKVRLRRRHHGVGSKPR